MSKLLILLLSLSLFSQAALTCPILEGSKSKSELIRLLENDRLMEFLDYIETDVSIIETDRNPSEKVRTSSGTAKWSQPSPYGWQSSPKYLTSLFKYLNLENGVSIVDVGSGYGLPGLLIGLLYPNVNYIGYEIVPERVEYAQAKAKELELHNVRYFKQDMSAANFEIAPAEYYYLYDPVNVNTLKLVIQKMYLANNGREFKVIFNPGADSKENRAVFEHYLEKAPYMRYVLDQDNFLNTTVRVPVEMYQSFKKN